MKKSVKRLRLHRETIKILSEADLRRAAGAGLSNTCYSCLTYVSCNLLDCYTGNCID